MKKFIACFLTLMTMASLCMPTFAVAQDNSDSACYTPMDEEWAMVADSYKITFDRDTITENDEMMLAENESPNDYDEVQKELAREHNANVAEQAKNFVRALNLSDKNFGYIEEFCLEELDYYASMEDAQLISYTVYTPKQKSGSKSSPTESDLMYFGTYQTRDFYFFYPSEAVTTTNIKKQSTKSILQQWAKAILSVLLSYNGGGAETISVTTTWSDIMSISSLPANYTVTNEAKSESYCDVEVHTRGIYTKYGNGDYEMVTSQQYGVVYPFVNFYPADRPNYPGCISYDYGYQGIVTSPRFNDGTTELCKEAWQKFYGSTVYPDRLLLNSLKTYWR